MFDVNPDDIAQLNDVDLRELVGRLCEAELASQKLSTAAVTWGGHQTAADGGLDVRVALPLGTPINGFVPRFSTGFQVKRPDLPRAAIIDEMRPHGVIRPVIQKLAHEAGAYVIVSSNGSTADIALGNRRAALREALAGVDNATQLHTDFYDRTRLATWVRQHPGLITWVKEKVGRALVGWRPYGPWSGAAEGVDAEYLLDDKLRLRLGKLRDAPAQPVTDAIDELRDELAQPGKIVRLVGLSGVGKTRFVQALFDARIGSRSLFTIYLSGTHATIEQRLLVIERLLRAEEPTQRSLGLAALDKVLKSTHFSSRYRFEFGARSRDYGLQPRTLDDYAGWYGAALALVERLAFTQNMLKPELGVLIARNFSGLWNAGHVCDQLEGLVRRFAAEGFWREGSRHLSGRFHQPEHAGGLWGAELREREPEIPAHAIQIAMRYVDANTYYGVEFFATGNAYFFKKSGTQQTWLPGGNATQLMSSAVGSGTWETYKLSISGTGANTTLSLYRKVSGSFELQTAAQIDGTSTTAIAAGPFALIADQAPVTALFDNIIYQ